VASSALQNNLAQSPSNLNLPHQQGNKLWLSQGYLVRHPNLPHRLPCASSHLEFQFHSFETTAPGAAPILTLNRGAAQAAACFTESGTGQFSNRQHPLHQHALRWYRGHKPPQYSNRQQPGV